MFALLYMYDKALLLTFYAPRIAEIDGSESSPNKIRPKKKYSCLISSRMRFSLRMFFKYF
jgi:hypothetical protein